MWTARLRTEVCAMSNVYPLSRSDLATDETWAETTRSEEAAGKRPMASTELQAGKVFNS